MKKPLSLFGLLVLVAIAARSAVAPIDTDIIPAPTTLSEDLPHSTIRAQITGGHSVALSWVLSTDDTTTGCAAPNTCSQTVYRAPAACSTSSAFASIATPAASTATFTDSSIVPGTYCYAVTFTQNGLESAKDTATVILPPASPSGLGGIPH